MKPGLRLCLLAGMIAAGIVLLRLLGLSDYLSLDNVPAVAQAVEALGWIGPAAYVLLWIEACLFFIPGLPVTFLGAAVFGAWWGLLYVTIGSNLGALAAFLAGRYAAGSLVENWARKNPQVSRIDQGVVRHGWRMVMITRLVPIFPFNLQNYAYGLTKISLATYAMVTFMCMIPASVAYCLAGGAVVSGQGSAKETLLYLAVAGVLFVLASLIPGWVKRRYAAEVSGQAGAD